MSSLLEALRVKIEVLDFEVQQAFELKSSARAKLVPFAAWGNPRSEAEVTLWRPSFKEGSSLRASVRSVWQERYRIRAAPTLVIGDSPEGLLVAIPDPAHEGEPCVLSQVSLEQAAQWATGLLRYTERGQASQWLESLAEDLKDGMPGIQNKGLFADRLLLAKAGTLQNWAEAQATGQRVLGIALENGAGPRALGEQICRALGYVPSPTMDGRAQQLRAKDGRAIIGLLLDAPGNITHPHPSFGGMSPLAWALIESEKEGAAFVFVTAGRMLRVYPTQHGVGVARQGRGDSFVEIVLDRIDPNQAGLIWLLASADALRKDGAFDLLLEESRKFGTALGVRLRERVYAEIVPTLVTGLVKVQDGRVVKTWTREQLDVTYEMALTIVFRLLFVAYAEDKHLFPVSRGEAYAEESLQRLAEEICASSSWESSLLSCPTTVALWDKVWQIWEAIDQGNKAWGIPRYNGGLFASTLDHGATAAGVRLATIQLSDVTMAPVLKALLTEEDADGKRQTVDFRALGVQEFGTIYEGLLGLSMDLAEQNLMLDEKETYVVAGPADTPVVLAGQPYLHSATGGRKASGSYYTPHLLVDVTLDGSLEPALSEHLARIDMLDEPVAAKELFAFRVADISMGSAHFLVAAIDRIERAFAGYLSRRPLEGVERELGDLGAAARAAMGAATLFEEADRSQLMRRLIARRCIFGADMNPMAVELGRLAVWIHTFVPGLPLSFLNHNLVVGDSLRGIGSIAEMYALDGVFRRDVAKSRAPSKTKTSAKSRSKRKKAEASLSLFGIDAAVQGIRDLAGTISAFTDRTIEDIEEAKRHWARIEDRIKPVQDLFTVYIAGSLDQEVRRRLVKETENATDDTSEMVSKELVQKSRDALVLAGEEQLLHFPVAFPHVFLTETPGFDVIVGNPPWEKLKVEEHAFWARYAPGLRGRNVSSAERERIMATLRKTRSDLVSVIEQELAQAKRARENLTSKLGLYPDMGGGDPQLERVFGWRFLSLLRAGSSRNNLGGRLGVVIPRSLLSGTASKNWRKRVLDTCDQIRALTIENTKGWAFPSVDGRYTISLFFLQATSGESPVGLGGPFTSGPDLLAGRGTPSFVSRRFLKETTADLTFPLIPNGGDGIVERLAVHPRLGDTVKGATWQARPVREFDATNDKKLFVTEPTPAEKKKLWRVFAGKNFTHWGLTSAPPYAWIAPNAAVRNPSGAKEDVILSPRIAFRDIARSTDARTLIPSIIPKHVTFVNNAPVLYFSKGGAKDQACVLGFLSSHILDWWTRCWVELHVTFGIFNSLPVPRLGAESILRDRLAELVAERAGQEQEVADWAKSVLRRPVPRLVELDCLDRENEIDAIVAHAYGLSRDDVSAVFRTFHKGKGPAGRLASVLEHYERWSLKLEEGQSPGNKEQA